MDYKDLVERAVFQLVYKEVGEKVLAEIEKDLDCIIRQEITPSWLKDVVQETIEYNDSISELIVYKTRDLVLDMKLKVEV